MTLVDTNVLLDIATDDQVWSEWSLKQLDAASLRGPILINPVVYSEFSVGFMRLEEVDRFLRDSAMVIAEIPRAALFLAGKVFLQYKKQGGRRAGVLPDFFLGAHAAVEGWPLLTRDPQRFRTYFPRLALIVPARPGNA